MQTLPHTPMARSSLERKGWRGNGQQQRKATRAGGPVRLIRIWGRIAALIGGFTAVYTLMGNGPQWIIAIASIALGPIGLLIASLWLESEHHREHVANRSLSGFDPSSHLPGTRSKKTRQAYADFVTSDPEGYWELLEEAEAEVEGEEIRDGIEALSHLLGAPGVDPASPEAQRAAAYAASGVMEVFRLIAPSLGNTRRA
jgi:hypothetical protein